MAIRISNVDVIDGSRNIVNIGNTIVSTAPTIALLNSNTTVNAFSSATSLTMGSVSGSTAVVNVGTGNTGSGATKTLNLGTGSGAGSTTNVNIGSSPAGTTTILSPLTTAVAMNLSGEIQANGGYGGGAALVVSADGTIQIAGTSGAINGTFMIRASGSNREHFMVVNVNAQPFGTNYISVVANHAFQDIPLLSNLRISTNGGNSARYFLLDIGNRAGANVNLRITAIGPQHNLNPLATPISTISSTTVTSMFAGITGNILVNTQSDDLATKLQIAGNISASSLSLADNLVFSADGKRIVGNLSDATASDRLAFQSSVVNGFSDIGVIPNGSSQIAALTAWNNSVLANTSYGQIQANATSVDVVSGRIGTGAFLPIRFMTSSITRLTIDTSGAATFTGNVAVNGGTLSTTAANAFLFNTDASSLNMAGVATSVTVGGTTATSTTNISTGTTVSGATKTLNLGTGGSSGSTTNVNIASGQGGTTTIASPNITFSATALTTINSSASSVNLLTSTDSISAFNGATFITIGNAVNSHTMNLANGATVSGSTKNVNIGRNGLAGSTTNVNIGSVLSSGSVSIAQNTNITGSLTVSSTVTGSRFNVGTVVSTPTVAVASGQAFNSGYTRLTNNIVMAWGISVPVGIDTTIDVTFPITFTTVFTVMPSMHNTNGGAQDDVFAKTINFTTSGATFRAERSAGSEAGTRHIHYIVIGIIN